ncbi:MAG: hypothetical protein CMH57_07630 [Myxococcales bacterium]|nr:hypothetical protein [Myxococcales bacterium]
MQLAWTGPGLKTRSPELRLGRELALRALYSVDLSDFAPHIAWMRCESSFFSEEEEEARGDEDHRLAEMSDEALAQARDIGRALLFAYWKHRLEIDGIIRGSSKRWKLSRMLPIERNILRLGTLELLMSVTPTRDVIYDCVELAKSFGDAPTPRFVNGILDQICQDNQITL